ncbi:MAG TPA: hypothetical protein VGV15_04630, partial [Terriglobales bacterium]|nr:hypothetical protein [Terriglobales bacterium]
LLYLPEFLSVYRRHRDNSWFGNAGRCQHIIKMWQFLLSKDEYRSYLSPRQIRLLKVKILEMTAYDSSLTGNNKVRGAVAGIQVPLVLLRNGLLFNWRHLALPLMCFIPVKRPAFKRTALRARETRLAVGRSEACERVG